MGYILEPEDINDARRRAGVLNDGVLNGEPDEETEDE